MSWFIVFVGEHNRPIPATNGDEDSDDISLFETEAGARKVAMQHPFRRARGFKVYPWPFKQTVQ